MLLALQGRGVAEPVSIKLPSATNSITAEGNTVGFTVTPDLTYEARDGALFVTGFSHLDLSDLQRKLPSILHNAGWPAESCARYGASNVVVSPTSGALKASGANAADLDISGSVAVWGCAQNPIPETRVEWTSQKVGPVASQVPRIVTSPGAPIKTVLSDEKFAWSSHVSLGKDATIQMDQPRVTIGGGEASSGSATVGNALMGTTTAIKKSLGQVLNASTIWTNVPDAVLREKPTIDSVEWTSQGGSLSAKVKWTAKLPESAANSLRSLSPGVP